jgi:histidine triad (HIT) family protein
MPIADFSMTDAPAVAPDAGVALMAREGIRAVVDCVFCNIVRGHAPAEVRCEDEEFLAFDDLFPKAETHLLVVPRAHHANLDEWIDAGGSSDRMLAFVSRAAREAGVAGRYRLVTNVGRDAGQLIYHVHWHVLAGDLPAF